jgi:putative transposase
MLTNIQVERFFAELRTPEGGRDLIRKIRADGPVRKLETRMDTVRTRFISKKMERAVYAESRTVELPAIVIRENDKNTLELWPQPIKLDIKLESSDAKSSTRVQHIPDLFLIESDRFVMEEWREEARLLRLAAERPQHSAKTKTASGTTTPSRTILPNSELTIGCGRPTSTREASLRTFGSSRTTAWRRRRQFPTRKRRDS